MKLATLNNDRRDGRLIVVCPQMRRYLLAPPAYPTLQSALDNWRSAEPALASVYRRLREEAAAGAALDWRALRAPLPRAYQWLDGSAFLNHVELARRARGASMPPGLRTDPLMYQGGSDTMLAWHDDIVADSESDGIDCEAEVAVITDDVARGCGRAEAATRIRLVAIVNDVSLRNRIAAELTKGFGFVQSKPPTAFAPVAVTPDALGDNWQDNKLRATMRVAINDAPLGAPHCAVDMQFDFAELIAHAAATRPLAAGTIIGSGTISNRAAGGGFACIAEQRMSETIARGKPITPFLRFGDVVTLNAVDDNQQSLFGVIRQRVVPAFA